VASPALISPPHPAAPDPDTLGGLAAAALDVSIDGVEVAALRAAATRHRPLRRRRRPRRPRAADLHQRAALQRLVEVMINPTTAQ
jgi:hypothetical protein